MFINYGWLIRYNDSEDFFVSFYDFTEVKIYLNVQEPPAGSSHIFAFVPGILEN